MYKIMLVDDEQRILSSLNRLLRSNEWELELYSSPKDALARARCCIFDVIISDYRMAELNGIDFLKEIKSLQPDSMRILLTASTESNTLIQAINDAGAFRFITKPWDNEVVVDSVVQALNFRDVMISNKFLAEKVCMQKREIEYLSTMCKVNAVSARSMHH